MVGVTCLYVPSTADNEYDDECYADTDDGPNSDGKTFHTNNLNSSPNSLTVMFVINVLSMNRRAVNS